MRFFKSSHITTHKGTGDSMNQNPILFCTRDTLGIRTFDLVKKSLTRECVFTIDDAGVEAPKHYQRCRTAEDVLALVPYPKVAVFTLCRKGINQEVVKLLRQRSPATTIVYLMYEWWPKESWHKHQPDIVLTNDEVSKKLVLQIWPGLDQTNIHLPGFPALITPSSAEAVNLGTELPVITFAGQLQKTVATLGKVVEALNRLPFEVALAPRKHPAMAEVPAEEEQWNPTLELLQPRHKIIMPEIGISDLVASSTVVLSMYSNVLLEAYFRGVPPIAVLFPELGQAQLEADAGISPLEHPLVELGAYHSAKNPDELYNHLTNACEGKLRNQRITDLYRTGNARRCAGLIESF